MSSGSREATAERRRGSRIRRARPPGRLPAVGLEVGGLRRRAGVRVPGSRRRRPGSGHAAPVDRGRRSARGVPAHRGRRWAPPDRPGRGRPAPPRRGARGPAHAGGLGARGRPARRAPRAESPGAVVRALRVQSQRRGLPGRRHPAHPDAPGLSTRPASGHLLDLTPPELPPDRCQSCAGSPDSLATSSRRLLTWTFRNTDFRWSWTV